MKILIVNDDGIHAAGIKALVKRLKDSHEITVVAPDSERSAASHSYSFKYPIFLEKTDIPDYEGTDAYVTNGTPADCVYLGLQNIRNNDIDLVISGINAGANLGERILALMF